VDESGASWERRVMALLQKVGHFFFFRVCRTGQACTCCERVYVSLGLWAREREGCFGWKRVLEGAFFLVATGACMQANCGRKQGGLGSETRWSLGCEIGRCEVWKLCVSA